MQVHKTQTRGREVSVSGQVHCVDQQKFVYFLKKLLQCDYTWTLSNTEFYQKMAISTSPKIYIKIPPIPSIVIQRNDIFLISIYLHQFLFLMKYF